MRLDLFIYSIAFIVTSAITVAWPGLAETGRTRAKNLLAPIGLAGIITSGFSVWPTNWPRSMNGGVGGTPQFGDSTIQRFSDSVTRFIASSHLRSLYR